jgi:fumarate hydratase subunit beta
MIVLKTPMREEESRRLKIGETVSLNGVIYLARDSVHQRIFEIGEEPPVDLRNSVIYHAGPAAKKENNEWKIVALGPTSSKRMNKYTPVVIRKYSVRALAGKGGIDNASIDAMKKSGCVYLAGAGGCGVYGAKAVHDVLSVHWLDLGVPEALWVLKVKDLRFVVAIDSRGNSLYASVKKHATKQLKKMLFK